MAEVVTATRAATPAKLIEALQAVPADATLWKWPVTGNLIVIAGGRQIGYVDLAEGKYDDWSEDWSEEDKSG